MLTLSPLFVVEASESWQCETDIFNTNTTAILHCTVRYSRTECLSWAADPWTWQMDLPRARGGRTQSLMRLACSQPLTRAYLYGFALIWSQNLGRGRRSNLLVRAHNTAGPQLANEEPRTS